LEIVEPLDIADYNQYLKLKNKDVSLFEEGQVKTLQAYAKMA